MQGHINGAKRAGVSRSAVSLLLNGRADESLRVACLFYRFCLLTRRAARTRVAISFQTLVFMLPALPTLSPLLVGASLLVSLSSFASAQTRFPFSMPWDDASHNALDASDLNPAPITGTQRLHIANGHFVDANGRRVRFVGTGLGASANFSKAEDSARFAARMHKFGFNIVRLHHMDAAWSQVNIFGTNRDEDHASNAKIDATNLDALDHTFANLKKNGIYSDLNLHVSRRPAAADGFPDADKLPELGKVVAYFDPKFIAMQKDYARQILLHQNPYTHTKWADDPALALVEINNEDSLVAQAWTGTLHQMPPAYHATLQSGWNHFLNARYPSTAALRTAWNARLEQNDGPNLLSNGQFADGANNWFFETQGTAKASVSVSAIANAPKDGPTGSAFRVAIDTLPDEVWKLQLSQNGLNLKPNTFYTVRFWGRADAARVIGTYFALDQAPWTQLGGQTDIPLTPDWTSHTIIFRTGAAVPNHSRLSLTLGNNQSPVEIADFHLSEGATASLPPTQTLETSSVDLPPIQGASEAQGRDWIEYLSALETAYVDTMRDCIKRECGFKGSVTCSQISYGGFAGVARESASDWTDMHAYWQHPDFPHVQWDYKDWRVANTPMLDDPNGGTLVGLATHRIEGKPFTVSEYNHPAPSDYASETLPLIFAYAGMQDWDGVFLFDYNGSRDNWSENKIRGFFDVDTDPNKMVFCSAMARAFLSGALVPAKAQTTLIVPKGQLLDLAAQVPPSSPWAFQTNVPDLWKASGMGISDALSSRLSLRLTDGNGTPHLERSGERTLRAANPAFDWEFSGAKGHLVVDSPSVKALVGNVGSNNSSFWPMSGLSISSPHSSNSWLSLVAVARDGKPLGSSSSILLSTLNRAENQNMTWNSERTSVGEGWGDGPTLLETPTATLDLETKATSATVWKLDATGKRNGTLASMLQNGRLKFVLSPSDATPFYEIALSPMAAAKAIQKAGK